MAHSTASEAWMRRRVVGSRAPDATLPEELVADPRWQLVLRITASESFTRAARLSSFLLYVTHQALARHGANLNEQSIGEKVFARPLGYDSREDNIVRAHASRLRQRLESYFSGEGAHESLRVSIPRGSYVPLFERIPAEPPPIDTPKTPHEPASAVRASAETVDVPAAVSIRKLRWLWPSLVAALLLAILIGTVVALQNARTAPEAEAAATPTHQLWSQMFAGDRNTLIVPADSSLVLFAELSGHRVSLADYATGHYQTNFQCTAPCNRDQVRSVAERRYTSLADLEFAVALARRPESIPSRTQVRFVRDLQLEDFKQSNLVLIGSLEADPWLELMENQMDFVLQDDARKGPLQIVNRRPHPGEQKIYIYDNDRQPRHGFAAVAFLPNLNGTGNVVIVQGFTLADTQAAAEFATDGKEFNALFAPLVGGRRTMPHFECLLRTTDVNGVASQPVVFAWHLHND